MNLKTQTFYGLIDLNNTSTPIANRSKLTPQTVIYEGLGQVTRTDITMEDIDKDGDLDEVKKTVTLTAPASRDQQEQGGESGLVSRPAVGQASACRLPGFKGEMAVSDPVIRNGRVIFTTIIPNDDPCTDGGTSWLMELDAVSGGRLDYTPLDLNDDSLFDSQDYITLKDENGNVIKDEDGNLDPFWSAA